MKPYHSIASILAPPRNVLRVARAPVLNKEIDQAVLLDNVSERAVLRVLVRTKKASPYKIARRLGATQAAIEKRLRALFRQSVVSRHGRTTFAINPAGLEVKLTASPPLRTSSFPGAREGAKVPYKQKRRRGNA